MTTAQVDPLRLDPSADVSLADAHRIAVGDGAVELGDRAVERLRQTRDRLEGWIEEGRRIYGVTTGFGPLADTLVGAEEREVLQENLVYHLATGVGEAMSRRQARAVMLARAVSLSRGYSAIRPASLERLLAFLNDDVHPVIPELGTVGASGDLTPLAHLALALMGEGEIFEDSERRGADEVLADRGLEPLELGAKEGLALVNGTSAMTGMAVMNGVEAVRAAEVGLRIAMMYAECVGGRSEAWDPLLGEVRPHPGQQCVHQVLGAWSESSRRLDGRSADEERLGADAGVEAADEMPQDPYSVRCLPQLYGAVLDAVWQHNETVERELNSVTDNPVIGSEEEGAIHGGNFYGQHVAFASDQLANAVLKIGIHLERCIARITDPERNGELPAFLQDRQTGLHSGLMGAQVSATSLVGEMRSRSTPASTQSIPTNADNQDVVTMGTTAARRTAEHLDRLWEIVGIAGITFAQAMDLTDGDLQEFSESSRELRETVRQESAPLEGDRPLSGDIEAVAELLREWEGELPVGGGG